MCTVRMLLLCAAYMHELATKIEAKKCELGLLPLPGKGITDQNKFPVEEDVI